MIAKHQHRTASRSTRRGAISIWALVCLIFVTALSATLGRVALLGSRQMIQERRHAQIEWLAHSGWLLAVNQLQRDAAWTGQTWDVSAASLGGADSGRVTIQVKPDDKAPEVRQVEIVAEFPYGTTNSIRLTSSRKWQSVKK